MTKFVISPLGLGAVALCVALPGAYADTAAWLVTQNGTGAVTELSASGATVGTFATLAGATGVVVDSLGNVYVASASLNKIEKFSPVGADLGAVSTGIISLSTPQGLAIDSSDNLYVADSHNWIVKIPASGTPSVFSSSNMNGPAAMAFDGSGDMFVSNYSDPIGFGTIAKIAPGGTGSSFVSGLSRPFGLAFDTSGNLYVANFITTAITKFSSAGANLGTFATISGTAFGAKGLAFDGAGNLYVLNSASGKIEEFSPTGTSLGFFASGLSGPSFMVPVPEPATFGLLALALGGLVCGRRYLR
jgi:sugar lactone lactonase YvrE